MELAREAAFVSAIGAVTVWLAWVESDWLAGQITTRHAVLALGAAAAASTALILAGRLATTLGAPGRWFVAAPASLLFVALIAVMSDPAAAEDLSIYASAASLATVLSVRFQ